MGSRVRRVVRRAWERSPRENVVTRFREPAPAAPWRDGKHALWTRLPYYADLFREIADREGHRWAWKGRTVLEVGAGPVLGIAPFAVMGGADACTVVEPGFREVRGEHAFTEEYLYPLWCAEAHGRAVDLGFDAFVERIRAIDVVRAPIEAAPSPARPFDLVLSKSCLEHIADLGSAVARMAEWSATGSLHAHYVDFSLHHAGMGPGALEGLLSRDPADQREAIGRGGDLNLLRPSQVVAPFREHFARVVFVPLLTWPGAAKGAHPAWRPFAPEDLEVANGVVLAVR